jgi:hypothetical protein
MSSAWRMVLCILAITAGLVACNGGHNVKNAPAPRDIDHEKPTPLTDSTLFGVTIDSVWNLDPVIDSLARLARRPTVRVVFDPGVSASEYASGVARVHRVGNVMGELVDSFAVASINEAAYQARATQFVNALSGSVDIWEVGNEVNGEWLGTTASVVKKITSAYSVVANRGQPTALTLYYNEGCWAKPENEMFAWAEANIPNQMKQKLDFVLISYYEDDCNHLKPDWPSVFQKLGRMFPNSKLGFGEVGTTEAKAKVGSIESHYAIRNLTPNFIGGYFWWYFIEDMVPVGTPAWDALNTAIQK